ncbi:MAG: hypothetical protein AAF490_11500 [Chloroflexota bacterium]
MNQTKRYFTLVLLFLIGCGSFTVEPVIEVTPNLDATVEARIALTQAANEPAVKPTTMPEGEAEVETAVLTKPTSQPVDQFLPEVTRFSDETNPAWGAAFCPEAVLPICIRPYAIEPLGDEYVLISEIWGSGNTFSANSNNLHFTFRAYDDAGEDSPGSDCGNTRGQTAHYSAGFGHQSHVCFRNLESTPSQIEMSFRGGGSRFTIRWDIGENGQAVGGYSFLSSAIDLPIDQPFNVGPATITIHAVEDLGDAVKLDVTVQANSNNLIVASPEWIVLGEAINFFTASPEGHWGEWDEGKMGAYELVGGEIEADQSQTGTVVITKIAPNAGLLITFGFTNTGGKDSAVFLLP